MPDRKGKWQPFDALEGYKDKLKEVEINKEKIDKPILIEDKILEINNILKNYKNEFVCIVYYNNGFLYKEEGFLKIDYNNNYLKINDTIKINFNDIINIII